MNHHSIIQQATEQINTYKAEHKGDIPLYIIVSPNDAKALREEARRVGNYADDVIVTSYQDIGIVTNDSLTLGELRLSNELPETGS